jgi:hypothetical protein
MRSPGSHFCRSRIKWAQAPGTREALDRRFRIAEPVFYPAAVRPCLGQIGIEHDRLSRHPESGHCSMQSARRIVPRRDSCTAAINRSLGGFAGATSRTVLSNKISRNKPPPRERRRLFFTRSHGRDYRRMVKKKSAVAPAFDAINEMTLLFAQFIN